MACTGTMLCCTIIWTILTITLVSSQTAAPANSDDVHVASGTKYSLRLYNATKTDKYLKGALEIRQQGRVSQLWTHVCEDDFDADAGNVACKMFGYVRGEVVGAGYLGKRRTRSFFLAFICSGREKSLDECEVQELDARCEGSRSIGLVCFNNVREVFEMQIADNKDSIPTRTLGRLEVRMNPVLPWGNVCDDRFNSYAASSACKYMGYKYGQEMTYGFFDYLFANDGIFGSNEDTWLDEVLCRPGQDFLDCEHDPWAYHDCEPREAVGIACSNYSVRLMSAKEADYHVGTVEMYREEDGGWFEVCDNSWDDNDAKVVCKQLGFVDGKAMCCNSLGLILYGSLVTIGSVTNVGCLGSESTLNDCRMEDVGLCDYEDGNLHLAGVVCYDRPVSSVDMNIVTRIIQTESGGFESAGILEVRHMGIWGRMCLDTVISDEAATVACKAMGKGYKFGKGISTEIVQDTAFHVWIREIKCQGNETSLEECEVPQWGLPGNLLCKRPTRVLCYTEDLSLSIVNPVKGLSVKGVLKITYDKLEYSVCRDGWTDNEAHAACKSMGYYGGKAWFPEVFVSDLKTILSGVICRSGSDNFFTCPSQGWGSPSQNCMENKIPAGVACFMDVKLDPSYKNAGALQVYSHSLEKWRSVCRLGFEDQDATVACSQFGFASGVVLPRLAFGSLRISEGYDRTEVNCDGSETDIRNCTYEKDTSSCSLSNDYVSISCFNTSSTGTYRLDDSDTPFIAATQASGTLQVHKVNTWGFACAESFSDIDAKVYCGELGRALGYNYTKGVKFTPRGGIDGPFFLTFPGCSETASVPANCRNSDYPCSSNKAARVLCYQSGDLKLYLNSDGMASDGGKLELSLNGVSGDICADDWDDNDATAACRELNPRYTSGVATTLERSSQQFYSSGFQCTGDENSLMECANDGWRSAKTTACAKTNRAAGVFCFGDVFLTNVTHTADSMSGLLNIRTSQFFSRPVCFTQSFSHKEAKIACAELGRYINAAILKPATIGVDSPYSLYSYEGVHCGGTESSLKNCYKYLGLCSSKQQVSLLCYTKAMNDSTLWAIENGSYGRLTNTMKDKTYIGGICNNDWNDTQADKVCKLKGYTGGKALGGPPFHVTAPAKPVWFGSIECDEQDSPTACAFRMNVNHSCFEENSWAGVICDQNVTIRLMDNGIEGNLAGHVEIGYNGVWGTVCNKDKTKHLQAKYVCQQLGFADGKIEQSATLKYGRATGPIYIKDVECSASKNTTLLQCPNAGWNETTGCTHDDDLEVICYSTVQLFPQPKNDYGAVSLMSGGSYKLVCSEGFGRTEAQVVCRSLGFLDGVSICCSGLSIPFLSLGVSRVSCTGTEKSLTDCNYVEDATRYSCASQHFASVACTKTQDESYRLALENRNKGRVLLKYFGLTGSICANNFDNGDAAVICKELNFDTGLAFKTTNLKNFEVSWTGNLQCVGSETLLSECQGFSLGTTEKCSEIATVQCFSTPDTATISVTNPIYNGEFYGRPLIQIGSDQGTLCNDPSMTQDDATVLCKSLESSNSGGIFIQGSDPASTALPPLVYNLRCNGKESSISDCDIFAYGGIDQEQDCLYGAAALQCFTSVELRNNNSLDNSKGLVALFDNSTNEWQAICDDSMGDTEATVICKTLGFQYGKYQCCNAFGPINRRPSKYVTKFDCSNANRPLSACTIVRENTCSGSGSIASVYCSNEGFPAENLKTLSLRSIAGPPLIQRYGIEGYACGDISQKEAEVMCRELGFAFSHILPPVSVPSGSSVIVSNLKCQGNEGTISACTRASINQSPGCSSFMAANIMCTNSNPIFKVSFSGRAEIIVGGRTFVLGHNNFNDREASVFCKSVDKRHMYGTTRLVRVPSTPVVETVFLDNIQCKGDEESILDCKAKVPSSSDEYTNDMLAYIDCHNGVELVQGPSSSSGILNLYVAQQDMMGTICIDGFGPKEADVACRMMNYEKGVLHCCTAFGYSRSTALYKNMKCAGTESTLLDCKYTVAQDSLPFFCSRQEYVGLTCYNGTLDNDFSVSVETVNDQGDVGIVKVTALGVEGSICSTGWTDEDASVLCKEKGYGGGVAYSHYKYGFLFTEGHGPFWLSDLNCTGRETSFNDCPHSGLGNVAECQDYHYAGVICTSGQGLSYRITGYPDAHYGRLEVDLDGTWKPVCSYDWDDRDAAVVCRKLGYATGDEFLDLQDATGQKWILNARCTGTESDLNECPHEGWELDSDCRGERSAAGVFCYSSVRLSASKGKQLNNGPVNIYQGDQWYRVCSDGFTDTSARKVCEDIGFSDGLSICCSAYSGEYTRQLILPNKTLECSENDASIKTCLKDGQCTSNQYASVVCFDQVDSYNLTDYKFRLKEDFAGTGRLMVNYLGIEGRICSNGWSDNEAEVFCKSQSYNGGFAYYHSYAGVIMATSSVGPFWMTNVNCSGTETDLSQCQFKGRMELNGCADAHTASVVCYREKGIEYRLTGAGPGHPNAGRVEMAIENVWGTVCDDTWDAMDAKVICREKGYKDGEPLKDAHYGQGQGPIWLRDIQCTGTESVLHQCPHGGYFNQAITGPSSNSYFYPCLEHSNDASVFCYKDEKLSTGLDMGAGGLLHNVDDKWTHVCSRDSFTRKEATVACKGLMMDYVDGMPIKGSVFGDPKVNISNLQYSCTGLETSLTECQTTTADCTSDAYISVACFNKTLTDEELKFQLRISKDSIQTGRNHGILEIRQDAVWGRVCLHGFTDNDASVACRQLTYKGGHVYLHLFRNFLPILWTRANCNGTENSLDQCNYSMDRDDEHCKYSSNEAGIVCYQNQGIQYRLTGGDSPNVGRVEIGMDGDFGTVCAVNWNQKSAKVFCSSLGMGFVDGIPLTSEEVPQQQRIDVLMSFFLCEGNETTLLHCLNSGFDSGSRVFYCGGPAYTKCMNKPIKIDKVRLSEGDHGRIEVYSDTLAEWGTVCDDEWDDLDARVVCRQLGHDDGQTMSNGVSEGEGRILMDNVDCIGTEASIGDCTFPGVNSHNCDHSEDVGVKCFNYTKTTPIIPVTPATSKPSVKTSTPAAPTSTPAAPTSKPSAPTSKPSAPTTKSTKTPTPSPVTPRPRTPTPSSSAITPSTTSSTAIVDGSSGIQSSSEDKNTTVIVAVVITIVVAIILIAVVIVLIFRYRRPKAGIPHERFHDDIIEPTHDGSLAMNNQMYDITQADGSDPMTQYMGAESEIHMTPSGIVAYSKSSPTEENGNTINDGFSNPLYSAMKNNEAETSANEIIVDMNTSDSAT